jgi:hypothetical protein
MPLESQELRSIIQTSRSLRYAFIVDPELPDIFKQINDIFQFSLNMWGGCLNAIIPIIKGEISQVWWELFKICDPDKVISCAPLNQETIYKIYKEICPTEINFTSDHNPI